MSNGIDLYVRHYLRGTATHHSPIESNDYDLWQMDWQFEKQQKSCTHMKSKLWAVSRLYTYVGEHDYIAFVFIEFYGSEHRILQLVFKDNWDTFEIIGDDHWIMRSNSLLMNCKPRPKPNQTSISHIDCKQNEKLKPDYRRESDLVKDDYILGSIRRGEESRHMFWVFLTRNLYLC